MRHGDRLFVRAPGKINLCFFLGELRDDGRHEVFTLLESVSLADELELRTDPGLDRDIVDCPGVDGPNLAARALAELRVRGWQAPYVKLRITKRVPIAAGMGGGSADAAGVLRLAAALAPLPDGLVLEHLAAELGSDVPSQLEPGLTLGSGAGELVQPVAPLAAHAFVLLPLGQALSTAAVYREADRLELPRPADQIAAARHALTGALSPGVRLPERLLVNDLEHAAVSLLPAIAGARAAVLGTGADRVLVSGSGPTVAGLYWDRAAGPSGPEAGAEQRAQLAAESVAELFPAAAAATPVKSDFATVRRVR